MERDERRREALPAQEKRQREICAGFESQGGTTIFVERRGQVLAVSEPSLGRSLEPLAIEDSVEALQGSPMALEPFKGSISPTPISLPPPIAAPPVLESKKRAHKHTNL
jgi:hypothetical protein